MSNKRGPRGKVERLIEKYDLEGLGTELQERYTGAEGERDSLRTLADHFNKRLLKMSFNEAAVPTTQFDIENIYNQLYHEDASEGELERIRSRLTYAGVPIEEVEADFISHEAVRTYLERNDVIYEKPDTDQVKKYDEQIQQLRSRTTTVTEDKLSSLASSDRITLGDFQVVVDINVFCNTCGTQKDVATLLTDSGCECDPD